MKHSNKTLGTLLPLSALLGPHNIQSDKNAFEIGYGFLDWLQKNKQSAWQLLPLHETQLETGSMTKHVPSPYKSYGIGLDPRFLIHTKSDDPGPDKVENFRIKHKNWIMDYSLFCALRDEFGTDNWSTWDEGLVKRDGQTIAHWHKKLQEKVSFYITQQLLLHEAYAAFHKRAQSCGISLIGDLPYYPSYRSPLVWAHQEVFQIGNDGTLSFVSGIPHTSGAQFGRQVWGHPLYNWDKARDQVCAFWKMRLTYLSSIFDHVRFDHAKAFFSYGVMDPADPSNDHYANGPGEEVFRSLVAFSQQQGLTIFVEDSGDRTETIRRVIDEIHVAGIRIFRFAIRGNDIHQRYADIPDYPECCVAYTTTHDTETLLGYLQTLSVDQKQQIGSAAGVAYTNDKAFALAIRNAVIASKAQTVIIPLQDWLLTTDRINIPGTEKEIGDTNWQYCLDMPIDALPKILTTA